MRSSSSWIFFFMIEIFSAAKLQFSTQCAHPTRCNRSSPPISTPAWDIFRSPSPPYAHLNSQTLDQRKKTVHFLDKCVHFRKKLHSFFLPSRHHSFPLPPSLARVGALARTRTQRVLVFCLHRTAIRAQPTENKWIAREAFTLSPTRYLEYNSL